MVLGRYQPAKPVIHGTTKSAAMNKNVPSNLSDVLSCFKPLRHSINAYTKMCTKKMSSRELCKPKLNCMGMNIINYNR